jgi:hypothetical protein
MGRRSALTRLGQWYQQSLHRRPLLTKVVQGVCISCVGDALAQEYMHNSTPRECRSRNLKMELAAHSTHSMQNSRDSVTDSHSNQHTDAMIDRSSPLSLREVKADCMHATPGITLNSPDSDVVHVEMRPGYTSVNSKDSHVTVNAVAEMSSRDVDRTAAAQLEAHESSKFKYDYRRTAAMATYAAVWGAPFGHFWLFSTKR